MYQGMLKDYRLRATQVLQRSMPESINRLQALVAEESNPDHPLWPGHLDQGHFLSKNIRLVIPSKTVHKGAANVAAQNGEGEGAEDEQEHQGEDEEEVGHDEDDEEGHIKDVQLGGDKAVQGWDKGAKDDVDGIKAGTSYPYSVPVNEINNQVIRIVRK